MRLARAVVQRYLTPASFALVWAAALAWAAPAAFAQNEEAGDPETVLLRSIEVSGNRATSERYIRSFLEMEEGNRYGLEEIIDLINISRGRLERTGLFRNIFFDDELVEESRDLVLNLTVQVREKNYLHFGPSGYLGYGQKEWYAATSVYLEYTNLYGNGSLLWLEAPVYQDLGALVYTSNRFGLVDLEAGYRFLNEEQGPVSHSILTRFGVFLTPRVKTGLGANLYLEKNASGEETDTYMALLPFFELGSRIRPDTTTRTWYYGSVTPVLAYGAGDFYGFSGEIAFYRDLFLKIIYVLELEGGYLTGDPPRGYLFDPGIRGTDPDDFPGEVLVNLTNEFRVPWPTYPQLVLVPFLDISVVGDDPEFLLGGGIGMHLYTKFQDPLVVEIGFGKGIMLNFSRNF
jgi:hypothetical protein